MCVMHIVIAKRNSLNIILYVLGMLTILCVDGSEKNIRMEYVKTINTKLQGIIYSTNKTDPVYPDVIHHC